MTKTTHLLLKNFEPYSSKKTTMLIIPSNVFLESNSIKAVSRAVRVSTVQRRRRRHKSRRRFKRRLFNFFSNLDTPSCDQIRSMKIAISHIFGPNGNIDLVPTLVRFGNSTSLPVPEIALVMQQRLR